MSDLPARVPQAARRRMAALVRGEWLLWRRNKLALFNSFVMPLVPFLLLVPMRINGKLTAEQTGLFLSISVAMLLLFVVYYNLLSAYVTRRDELVLKRWRTGECSDVEILSGIAVPALLLSLVLTVAMSLVAVVGLGQAPPRALLLLLLAVLGGAVLFGLFALVTTVFTRNAEAAQITSLPLVVVSMAGAGFYPVDAFPQWVQTAMRFTPLAPSTELTRLGWDGRGHDGVVLATPELYTHALVPVAVLLGWLLLTGWVARGYFRWEPRA